MTDLDPCTCGTCRSLTPAEIAGLWLKGLTIAAILGGMAYAVLA